jgi:hypothetical protein
MIECLCDAKSWIWVVMSESGGWINRSTLTGQSSASHSSVVVSILSVVSIVIRELPPITDIVALILKGFGLTQFQTILYNMIPGAISIVSNIL